MSSLSSLPSHARPSHTLITPRLIIRSALPSDAKPFHLIRSEPLNSTHGGVHEPDLPFEFQAEILEGQKASTAKGENAFMVIILKPQSTIHKIEDLAVHDGILIGMTGFNSFFSAPSSRDPSNAVLVGDTGALIDYRYSRKGYALEAMEAIIDYGFEELGCEIMSLDTSAVNTPFRGLMQSMGLEDTGTLQTFGEGPLGGEILYRFEKDKWEESKKHLRLKNKWLL